jgi:hypothetical protein
MKMLVREQIKTLLAQENLKMKEIALKMQEKTGKNYSLQNLSHRLKRGTVTYNEVLLISEILGYKIKFEKENI